MMRALSSGVSGLSSQQLKMDVIGNNISNVNTVGYKASRIRFNELFNQVLMPGGQTVAGGTTNPVQVGLGVRTGSIDRQFLQGVLQTTGAPTDLAIQGDAFFVVGNEQQQFYTRAGNFRFDAQGRLVTPDGYFVKGWMADENGELSQSAALDSIVLATDMVLPAAATTRMRLAGNLSASAVPVQEVWTSSRGFTLAADGQTADGTADLNDLAQTTTPLADGDTIVISGTNPDGSAVSATFTYGAANDGTTLDDLLTVLNNAFTGATATLENGKIVLRDDQTGDSQLSLNLAAGAGNTGRIELPGFVNTAEGLTPKVTTSALVYDSLGTEHTINVTFTKTANDREWSFEVSVAGDATVTQGGKGTLLFNPDGTLASVTFDQAQSTLVFEPNNGADPVAIELDFGQSAGVDGLTLFDGTSTVKVAERDGRAQGVLTSFNFDETGKLFGVFSNGVTRLVAQVALSRFNNPAGLSHLGNNLFAATAASGTGQIGKAGEEIASTVFAGTLEASNVDLAQEFTEMIIAQRAFQANARTITVSDQLLSEVVQLKR